MNDVQKIDAETLRKAAERLKGSGASSNHEDGLVPGEILKAREPGAFDILVALYPSTLRFGHSARDIEAVAFGIEHGMFDKQPLPRWLR